MISLLDGIGSTKKKVPEKVFSLRLDLVGTDPRIWRRVLVRESMWLARMHDCIQVLFDWFDYQTHAFCMDDLRLGNPVKSEGINVEDDRDVALADLDLEHRGRFTYEYHFGEVWQIDIKVEQTLVVEKGRYYPQCIAGARAGPPEDCGGLEAFHDLLACIKQPKSDLGKEWLAWFGPDYDPKLCDLEKINKALRKIEK